MLRTLIHYRRIHLAVVLGAAVATAVLTGALLVGDSIRGSLRELTLDRLGRIERVVIADRFVRRELAEAFAGDPAAAGGGAGRTAPVILLRGSAAHASSGARASSVTVLGIDERFAALYPAGPPLDLARAPGQIGPSVVLNASLARELGAGPGDAVLLRFPRPSEVPRETVMGETDTEDVVGTLRAAVKAVIPDRGPGRFGLDARQQNPQNAFVAFDALERVLDSRGRANAVLVAAEGPHEATEDPLAGRLTLEDLGLEVERRGDHLTVESAELILGPAVDTALGEALGNIGARFQRRQSYLANWVEIRKKRTPYALVAGFDPLPDAPWSSLTLVDGTPAPRLGPDEILLGTWAAEDLGARPGDEVKLTYWVVGPRERLREESTSLRLAGIVAMTGLGADPSLTPDFPGIEDAEDIAGWDPPFPVDLGRIRPRDEAYWDLHRTTPKAYVSEATGQRLWSTRFGTTTSIAFASASGADVAATERAFTAAVLELPSETFGIRVRPVREQGLAAAAGATDFAGLFLGFSSFLIVSAAILVGLLFRLGVERRAAEIGLRLAVGYRVGSVLRRLVGEGLVLGFAGGVLGLALAVGYAWLMVAGLRTLWRPAVGSSELHLHASATSLVAGPLVALAVVALSVLVAVRKLVCLEPHRLLAGSWAEPVYRPRGRVALLLAWGGLLIAACLLALALLEEAAASPGLALATGTLLLVSGLACFGAWSRASRRRGIARGLVTMAARNSAWNPGRSQLSVALVASASFVILLVAASREDPGHAVEARDSGAGGFRLLAEADVELPRDLNDADARAELGFPDDSARILEGTAFFPFRRVPGEDASCLNLYRPQRPRLLGVPEALIERGGFAFHSTLPLPDGSDNPWALLDRPLEDGVVPAIGDFNSVRWILHLGLGQELTLEDEQGRPLRLRLVGLLRGSVFQSELLLGERDLLAHFPSRAGDGFFLIDAPEARSGEVARLLESTLAPYGLDVTTTRERLAGFKTVENTYLSTFQLLGGLGLLLGTVGLGAILLRNTIERTGELATLRAFGFRRSRLAWLIVAENAFLLLVGLGIGGGAALAASAPRLATIEVPWLSLAVTLGLVLCVGLLASVVALRGALGAPLLPALKADR